MIPPTTAFRADAAASLAAWAAANPGLASLLDAWRASAAGASQPLRLATAHEADLRAYARLHEVGPEVELLRVIDAPGGFRFFGNGPAPGSRGALPPIPSEAAAVAAVHALRDALASLGAPAPAPAPMAPRSLGGLPLPRSLPSRLLLPLGQEVSGAMLAGAEAETAAGASRAAPDTWATDLEHDDLPVYDVRLAPSALSAALLSHRVLGHWRGEPILVRQRAAGGARFWLLLDGAAEGDVVSGFANEAWAGTGFARETWPREGTDWLPAPGHLARRRARN